MSNKIHDKELYLVEGSLKEKRINKLLDLFIEKEHLFGIREMLEKEGFDPDQFFVGEYPIEGVYVCHKANQEDFFTVAWDDELNALTPTYTTEHMDENGYNCFNCDTIKESIALTEV